MKRLLSLLFGLVLILGAGAAPVPVKTQLTVSFSHDGLDVQGGQENLLQSEIAITAPTVDLNAGGAAMKIINAPCVKGTTITDATALITGRAVGNYRIWARAFDTAFNASAWAGPVDIVIQPPADTTPPTPPTSVGCSGK